MRDKPGFCLGALESEGFMRELLIALSGFSLVSGARSAGTLDQVSVVDLEFLRQCPTPTVYSALGRSNPPKP
jgi:hypothetical protein